MPQDTAPLTFTFAVGDDRFVAKLPTLRERLLFRPVAEQLYGGTLPPLGSNSDVESDLARVIAELQGVLTEAPDWWRGADLFNPERVYDVWGAYVTARDALRRSVEGSPVQPAADA